MKQHICILILFFILSTSTFLVSGQNQSFFEPIPHKTLDKTEMIVIYNIKYSPDSTNIQDRFETKAVLYIGNEISLYQCLYSVKREEIMRGAENMDDLRERAMNAPNARFAGRYFKNYPSGKITVTDRVIPDSFIYQEDITRKIRTYVPGPYTVKHQIIKDTAFKRLHAASGGGIGLLGFQQTSLTAMDPISFPDCLD